MSAKTKILVYVDLSDLPCCDEMLEAIEDGLYITLSPSRPTLLDFNDFNEHRGNATFVDFFKELDALNDRCPGLKVIVYS